MAIFFINILPYYKNKRSGVASFFSRKLQNFSYMTKKAGSIAPALLHETDSQSHSGIPAQALLYHMQHNEYTLFRYGINHQLVPATAPIQTCIPKYPIIELEGSNTGVISMTNSGKSDSPRGIPGNSGTGRVFASGHDLSKRPSRLSYRLSRPETPEHSQLRVSVCERGARKQSLTILLLEYIWPFPLCSLFGLFFARPLSYHLHVVFFCYFRLAVAVATKPEQMPLIGPFLSSQVLWNGAMYPVS